MGFPKIPFGSSEPDPNIVIPHAGNHENGGSDEINVAGLSGLLVGDQHVIDAEVEAISINEVVEDTSPQLGANLNKSTFGIVENITSHSATEAVTASTMYGNIHKITGAYTLTLPAAVVGMSGLFRATTAAIFSIKAGVSCHFEMIDGTVLDNGDKQTSGGTKNAWLHIHCEVANVWITSGQHGTMEDTGA